MKNKLSKKDLIDMVELTLHSAIELTKMVNSFYDDGDMDKKTYNLVLGIIGIVVNNYSQYETLYMNNKEKLEWIRLFEITKEKFVDMGKKEGFIMPEDIIEN